MKCFPWFYSNVLTLLPSCWLNIFMSRGPFVIHFLLPPAAPSGGPRWGPWWGLADCSYPRPAAAATGSCKGLPWRPHSRVLKFQRSCGNRAGSESVFTFTAKSMLKGVEIGVEALLLQTIKNSIFLPQEHPLEYWINWSLGLAGVHGWTTDRFWF